MAAVVIACKVSAHEHLLLYACFRSECRTRCNEVHATAALLGRLPACSVFVSRFKSRAHRCHRCERWLMLLWQIFEWVKAHGGEPIIPFSGIFENKLFDMPDDEKAAYCKEARPPSVQLPD